MDSAPVFSIAPENRFSLRPEFLAQYAGKEPNWGPIGAVVFARTYSRRVEGENRNEHFWEACRRVVEGIFSILKQHQRNNHRRFDDAEAHRKAQDMYERMFAFKFLPPGRGMFFMGTRALELKGSAALNNCGFVSTKNIDVDFSDPFCTLMDFSMLGVGMGFDVKGAGKVIIQSPTWDLTKDYVVEDTREGWVDAVRVVLNAFVGEGLLPREFDFSKVRPEGAALHTFGGTASGPQPLIDLLDTITDILFSRVGKFLTATDIVDIQNYIGKCVVAGNVRRSSEIALGDPNDEEFVALKDPTEMMTAYAKQYDIARSLPEWQKWEDDIVQTRLLQDGYEFDAELNKLVKVREAYTVLDTAYEVLQTTIDLCKKNQDAILRQNEAWLEQQAIIDGHPLMTHRWASNNTVLCRTDATFDGLAEMTVANGEPGYGFMDNIRKYGRMREPIPGIDAPLWADKHADGFNPCAEQTLWDRELCCLVETFPTNHATLEDYLATLKMAYLYAKTVTLVPTHRPATNEVMQRNRRIGTSMAGVFEMYEKFGMSECTRWWDEGYKFIRELDEEYSGWLGVSRSNKVTSIKPGGTIPLLVGKEGGMKLPNSNWYFRTVRVAHDHPIVKAHEAAGYRVEDDRTTPRTKVIYFPVKNPVKTRTAKEVTMWEQLELCAQLQEHWADNMVSVTITFQPHEAKDVKYALRAFAGRLKTVSFLPVSDHKYLQAPYIECTEAQYEEYASKLKPVTDLFGQGETHDVDEKFCDGGACEYRPTAAA